MVVYRYRDDFFCPVLADHILIQFCLDPVRGGKRPDIENRSLFRLLFFLLFRFLRGRGSAPAVHPEHPHIREILQITEILEIQHVPDFRIIH